MSITGTLQQGNSGPSQTAVISVLPGTTLNVGTYFANFFSTLTVNGSMNAGVVYTDNSTSGHQFLNGSGTLTTGNFIGSGGGTVEFSNGVLNVTSSASIGPFGLPGTTQRLGCTFQQDSGEVNIAGTGDGFTIGTSNTGGVAAYTQLGGVLNVPNEYVELCYATGTAATSSFQVLGSSGSPAAANVYGISLGQTVNNGVQNGNGAVKLGDAGSLMVIGSGGIVAASSGSLQVLLGSGTLASSAPWSTTVPLTLNAGRQTNINATSGTISLDGPVGGSGGLQEIGTGVLVLGGTNTYTGGTTVAGGEMVVTNNEGIADATNLYVGGELALFGSAVQAQDAGAAAGQSAAAVPEPCTAALLAIGAAILLLFRRRGRH